MKKMINILLLFVLLFPSFTVASEQTETKETAVTGTVQLLQDLNVFPQTEGNLTRGAFAAFAARLCGAQLEVQETECFADVKEDYEYWDDLLAAKSFGLIYGDENGFFSPNDNITRDAAVEILLRLLGYWDYAQEFGGISACAAQIGLTANLPQTSGEYVDVKMYTKLMENALDIPVMELETVGGNQVKRSRTLLEAYLGLELYSGRITACSETTLLGDSDLQAGELILTVGEEELQLESDLSGEKLYALLGRKAKVYASWEQGVHKAVSLLPQEQDSTLEINAEDLLTEQTDKRKLVYRDAAGKKEKTARISPAAYVIYNRRALPGYTDRHFQIQSGKIRLVDWDADGVYDVAVITEERYTLVQTVNTETKMITDAYRRNNLDLSIEDNQLMENGMPLELSEVNPDDLVASETDEQGNLTAVRRIRNRQVGTVEEVGEEQVVVDGTPYPLSGFYQQLAAGEETPDTFLKLRPKEMVCLLLSEEGYVVAAVRASEQEDMRYGFLTAVAPKSTISSEFQARMLTDNGEIEVFPFEKSCIIDGKRVKAEEILDYFIEKLGAQEKEKMVQIGKIVRYALTEEGLLSRMDTEYFNEETEQVKTNVRNDASLQTIQWCSDAGSFSGIARIGGQTKLFRVPVEFSMDDGEYDVITTANLTSGVEYQVAIYDIASDGMAGAAYLCFDRELNTYIDGWNPVYMIDEVTTALDAEGATIQKIYAYTLNGRTELILKDTVSADGLQKGDLIRCGIDSRGQVDNIEIVFRPREHTEPYMSHENFTASYWFWYGQVQRIDGNVAYVSMNAQGADKRYFDLTEPMTSRCHYLYDGKTKKITEFEMEDLIGAENFDNATWILMYAWKGKVKDVFAFQNVK